MKDLKERTLRSGFAKIFVKAATFLLRMSSLMVLARLLDPKDFGLVGMVMVVSGVFALFKEAGLSMAAVQSSTINIEQVSTLFWINMSVGVTLAFLLIALAPLLVSFYHESRLFWVAVALAADFIFTAAGAQHSALLQRQMRFVALAVIEILALVAGIVVGIVMAIGGYKYWALVGMAISQPAVSALCLWLTTRWIPGRPRWGGEVRSMVNFGGKLTLNSLITYTAYNFEKILLGHYWGAEALGIYGRAYQLINIPTSNLNSAVGDVAFSALSRVQDDPKRFKIYFLKGYSLLLSMTLPVTIACALFADDLIFVFLGPKWKDAVMIFRLLSPTILVLGLINPLAWILFSLGLVGRSLRIALVLAPLVMLSYVMGLPYGPNGVAFAYSSAMVLWSVPHILWCIHGTMISFRDLLVAAGRPFISSIVAALGAFSIQYFYGQTLSPLPRLILGSSILLVVYLWMLLYVMGQKALYLDLFQGMKRRPSVGGKESATI